MTAQVPDRILLDGESHCLYANPLEKYFDEEHPRPNFPRPSTDIWRGYIATWEIDGGIPYLDNLRGYVAADSVDYPNRTRRSRRPLRLKDIFPGCTGRVAARWFSGTLRIPLGELLEYIHSGYESTYERDLLLTIEDGILVGRGERSNLDQLPDILVRRDVELRREAEFLSRMEALHLRLEGKSPPWSRMSRSDKVVTVLAVITFPFVLPFAIPFEIHKHGWNPKRWKLF